MIKCGKCGEKHETVQYVKDCYAGFEQPLPVNEYAEQREYMHKLEHDLPNRQRARYAVTLDGVTKFYQVDKPRDGHWAGRTFLRVQASDETYPVKSTRTKVQVYEAIRNDPKAAMLRYGREIGKCGHCGRTLTNEESREYGIGPICRGRMGW